MTTFGVEIEMCANVSIKHLVHALQNKKINVHYVDPKQPTSKYWKIEKDESVLCNGKNRFGISLKSSSKTKMYPMEIVSPILFTYKSLSQFLKKMHSLNITYSNNQTQGFHVHLSNKYLQLPLFADISFGTNWITTFCINWTVFEQLILSTHDSNRLTSPHARTIIDNLSYSNRMKEFDHLDCNDNTISFNYIFHLFNPTRKNYGSKKVYPKGIYHNINLSNGRNSVVNLANLQIDKLNRKGTIEIRSHEGTVDPKKILTFVKFMKKFFNATYDKKSKTFVDARILVNKITGKSFKNCSINELSTVLNTFLKIKSK